MAKNPKRPRDPNQLGKLIADIATGEAENDRPEKADSGRRKGGIRGGKSRAAKLTAEERKKIALDAAKKRWSDN